MELYQIENLIYCLLLCSTHLLFVTGTLLAIFNKKRIEFAIKILKITLILYFLTLGLWGYISFFRTYAY
jgi:hypothetical protein